jgi:hypothetical protein
MLLLPIPKATFYTNYQSETKCNSFFAIPTENNKFTTNIIIYEHEKNYLFANPYYV